MIYHRPYAEMKMNNFVWKMKLHEIEGSQKWPGYKAMISSHIETPDWSRASVSPPLYLTTSLGLHWLYTYITKEFLDHEENGRQFDVSQERLWQFSEWCKTCRELNCTMEPYLVKEKCLCRIYFHDICCAS